MKYLIIFFLFLKSLDMSAQCSYVRDNNVLSPVDTFNFGGTKILAVYSSKTHEGNKFFYNETIIKSCFDSTVLFDTWYDGTISSTLHRKKDTLIISQYSRLPIGKKFAYVDTPFFIDKICFIGNQAKVINTFDPHLRKYSAAEIKKVLQNKVNVKPNNDATIALALQLFWASVSGSKEASLRLDKIIKKLKGFGGAYAEDWDALTATYYLWKQLNKKAIIPNP